MPRQVFLLEPPYICCYLKVSLNGQLGRHISTGEARKTKEDLKGFRTTYSPMRFNRLVQRAVEKPALERGLEDRTTVADPNVFPPRVMSSL
jgi:hypothetical protein